MTKKQKEQKNTYFYQTVRALKRKLYLVDLRGGKCEGCGYKKNLAALDFHHKDPKTKSGQLDARRLSNSTMEWILSEFEKCLVLCSNCHREEHHPDSDIENIRDEVKKYDDEIIRVRVVNKPKCCDCGTEINYSCVRCTPCNNIYKRKVQRPELHVLLEEKKNYGAEWCAKKYTVHQKTIRKWIHNMSILAHTRSRS